MHMFDKHPALAPAFMLLAGLLCAGMMLAGVLPAILTAVAILAAALLADRGRGRPLMPRGKAPVVYLGSAAALALTVWALARISPPAVAVLAVGLATLPWIVWECGWRRRQSREASPAHPGDAVLDAARRKFNA